MVPYKNAGKVWAIALSFISVGLFFSCKKTDIINNPTEQPFDFSKKIIASVSGFVTNENNSPAIGANVQYGELVTTTDLYGYFEINSATVIESAGVVTIKKTGYFNAIKTFVAEAGKKNFCRIKLIPKTNSGSIDAATGGDVTLSNGLKVSLPAAGIVDAATKAAYSGTVNVSSSWINPVADDINKIMPGDLRGINTNGSLQSLTSFGMAAVELTGSSGQQLQIADGKKATLTFPLPNTIAADAPPTIPLWYFDEVKGLWIEEGTATKTGNTYVGSVKHFTFWNCDLPNATVQLTFTVMDPDGSPVENTFVDIVPTTSNSWSHAGGYTDSTGYVNVLVTANASYKLTVSDGCNRNNTIHTQLFSVGTIAAKLGNITIPEANITTASGTIVCNGSPADENAYIIINRGNGNYKIQAKNDGSFSFKTFLCDDSEAINLTAVNPSTLHYSNTISFLIQNGNNSIPPINVCQNSVDQSGTFINYTVNGVSHLLISPDDTVFHDIDTLSTDPYYAIQGRNFTALEYVSVVYKPAGVVMGGFVPLGTFVCNEIPGGTFSYANNIPPMIHFTEYGNIGEFISGNVTGSQFNTFSPTEIYNFSCSFRIKRVR